MHKTICATFRGKPVENVETVENSKKPRLQRASLPKAVNAYALPSLERLQLSDKEEKWIDKKTKSALIVITKGDRKGATGNGWFERIS